MLAARLAMLSAASSLLTAAHTLAGPLSPPAGPVAPTHKTLTEVEPRIAVNAMNTPGDDDSLFKITQPGSYYLTGNITGVIGKHGIEIVVRGVTLDLNGFDLMGVAGMGAFDGVNAEVGGLVNIAVVNGSVRNWGDDGVDLNAASNSRIDGVLSFGNAGDGIVTDLGSTVSNCSAHSNMRFGIATDSGNTVSNCSARENGGTGIMVGFGGTVSNCSALQNVGTGISAGNSCTVSNCTAASNAGSGIGASGGCTVADCTVGSNVLDGIRCFASCTIRGNVCSSNGSGASDGAGIRATSSDNRIEGNNCIGADRGIRVDVAGNIIIHNTCSGNTTNWDIAANNVVGPILDRTAPASAAILGNSAPSSLGTTEPNANFTY